ncbi:MAG TPA: hypothetical protein PLU87_01790 [Sedimentisphaerales bacterium]|nr:hypothetical protein [Sedimentisphaerales bacterium]HRS09888.1 hypothetical protein [Sedimentisphaerales bacterium]HRV46462.1 hypothetical protein [Sedimentisphaerales bacterium]
MKSPWTKLAVAAAVLIACLIGLSLWRTTGSGIALADVLTEVEKAKSVRWDISGVISIDGSRTADSGQKATYLFSQEWGQTITIVERSTDPNGGETPVAETYFSLQKKTLIQIDHLSKRYTRTELDDAVFRQGQEIMSQATDPGRWLRMIMKCKYESLGRSIVDGVEVEGFRTTDPNIGGFPGIIDPQVDEKVWVDVKTRLPVRLEQNGEGVARTGGRVSIHAVLDHIQWDLPLTGADFAPPPVPEGYLVVVDKLPGSITEEGAIQGLRQCVEWLGKYPGDASIALPEGIQSALDGSDSPAAVRLKEELKGLTEQDRINRLMEAGTPLRRVQRFFVGLNADKKDPAYYGKTVTPQDADKVLLRWKVSDSEYRVIFGDLHAETVSPEKLAELEKALPK